jgi:CTP:molybdopterin cytidylyltransferase MocA
MASSKPIGAVVLAAGRSRRMGSSKPLLQLGGRTFVARVVRTCSRSGLLCVVVRRAGQSDLAAHLDRLQAEGCELLQAVNPDPDAEMIDSFRMGASELLGARPSLIGTLIWPVDFPGVSPETVETLIKAARNAPEPVWQPAYDGKGGHPAYIPRSIVDLAMNGASRRSGGLRAVIGASGVERLQVTCRDPTVTINANRPEDLERLRRAVRSAGNGGV